MDIVCDSCSHTFASTQVKVQEGQVKLDGICFKLIYFVCPKCNKIYKVSLIDKRYEELLKDLEKVKRRIRRNRGVDNVELQTKLSTMATKKYDRLKQYVDKLNSKYTGTFTFASVNNDKDENKIVYLP